MTDSRWLVLSKATAPHSSCPLCLPKVGAPAPMADCHPVQIVWQWGRAPRPTRALTLRDSQTG